MKSIPMGLMFGDNIRASAYDCCSRRKRGLGPTSALPLLVHEQAVGKQQAASEVPACLQVGGS